MSIWRTVLAALIGILIGLPISIYADETRPEPRELMERPAPAAQEILLEEPAQEKTGPERTDQDVDVLARLIYWEAGNQDEYGKRLVADTVLNRAADQTGRFPDNIVDVIYQPGQFSVVELLYTADPPEECYRIALEEMTDQADWSVLWFNCGGYLPYGEQAFQHGDHYFSR